MSYGTVVINDGSKKLGNRDSFVVNLNYRESKYVYRDGGVLSTGGVTEYSKSYTRLTPDKGVMASVKSFVAQFSGCEEAHKLRKRMIALDRRRNTISGVDFRFPAGCE